ATERVMIGQIQVVGCSDYETAKNTVLQHKDDLLQQANDAYPSLVARGGGARDLDVRILNDEATSKYSQMLIVHIYVDTRDAMGANMINTMAEALAPTVEQLTGGKVYL